MKTAATLRNSWAWLQLTSVIRRACLVGLLLTAESYAGSSVVLLHSPEMDWPQGRMSVEAELRASGYEVAKRESAAVEPQQLLTELTDAVPGNTGLGISVTVLRMGRSGLAYVWIACRNQTYRVVASGVDPESAAHVLSLRVVELISMETEAEPPAPKSRPGASTSEAEFVPPTPSDASAQRWLLSLGFGLAGGSGINRPSLILDVGGGLTLTPSWSIEGDAQISLAPAFAEFDEGRVNVSETHIAVRPLAGTDPRQQLSLQAGPSLGLQCLSIRALPDTGGPAINQNHCGFLPALFLRASARWDHLSFWLTAQPGIRLRALELVSPAGETATIGQPWMSSTLGVSWQ